MDSKKATQTANELVDIPMTEKRGEVKFILKPYSSLNGNFTQVCNTMFTYIDSPYTFSVYFYLCMRYNSGYDYAFPSLSTISTECKISVRKVQECIQWLCDRGFIKKAKYKETDGRSNNIYYIRYIELDKESLADLATEEKKCQYGDDIPSEGVPISLAI